MSASQFIIGVDEAGRGPLAGPVAASAVILCAGGIAGLDDSKKLSAKKRAVLEGEIKATCRFAISLAEPEEIDRLNILQATLAAMWRAVDTLVADVQASQPEADFLILVDGNKLPKWAYRAQAIVGGDALHPCISAASILAKEARDRIMLAAAETYPQYGWVRNKGYPTAEHRAALIKNGATPLHRRSFAPVSQLELL